MNSDQTALRGPLRCSLSRTKTYFAASASRSRSNPSISSTDSVASSNEMWRLNKGQRFGPRADRSLWILASHPHRRRKTLEIHDATGAERVGYPVQRLAVALHGLLESLLDVLAPVCHKQLADRSED